MDDPHSKEEKIKIGSDDDILIVKKSRRKEAYSLVNNVMISENNSIDFESVAPYLMDLKKKKE